jgi:hypothetical protein
MTIQDYISAGLLGIISLVAGWVALYWHLATKGTWREWPAGQSLMGLLGIITVGFGFGVVNRFLGQYPGRQVIGILLYAAFVGAIIWIGLTVRKEMRNGKQRLRGKCPTQTGPVTVTVATKNEEKVADDE